MKFQRDTSINNLGGFFELTIFLKSAKRKVIAYDGQKFIRKWGNCF